MSKNPLKSKTLWVNAIAALSAFFPSVAERLTPELILAGMGLINFILRLVTKDKLELS